MIPKKTLEGFLGTPGDTNFGKPATAVFELLLLTMYSEPVGPLSALFPLGRSE